MFVAKTNFPISDRNLRNWPNITSLLYNGAKWIAPIGFFGLDLPRKKTSESLNLSNIFFNFSKKMKITKSP